LCDADDEISIKDQCDILGISRSSFYYEPVPMFSDIDIQIMNVIDKIYTAHPFYGYRKHFEALKELGYSIGSDRVRQFMRVLDLKTFYPKRTTIPNKEHRIYPYLLRNLKIERRNQVWAIDITYIRLSEGFCYLIAIVDWFSRYCLSYRVSNSMDVSFCLDALDDALRRYNRPEIINSDQGSQFTSESFTSMVISNGIQMSMDSVGRWADNIIIERFFRSLKWEDIYLNCYQTVKDVRIGGGEYIDFYNHKRFHAALGYATPWSRYCLN